MKTFQVYVLVNRGNRRFIATAECAEDEVKQHNRGAYKWTAQFKPWKLEWASDPMPRRDAERLEKKLVPFKTNADALHAIIEEQY